MAMMDVTAIEGALVELEGVSLDADDDDVREAAARAMVALVEFISTVSPDREIEAVEAAAARPDSTLAALRDMGDRSRHPLDTQTPHSSLSRARRRPKPNMM